MRPSTTGAAAALALLGQASAQNFTFQCYDGLAVFINRASTEPLGFGVLAVQKNQILDRVPNSGAWYNPYPATLTDYGPSQMAGVGNLTQAIKTYVDQCPCHKIALLGFSQGAHVISDTLIGPSYPAFVGFGFNDGIDTKYTDAIAAAALFADPSNIAGIPTLDAGNSTQNGIFQRNNTGNWAEKGLTDRVREYCQAGDYYCASGNGSQALTIHVTATFTYGAQGVDFIVNTWENGSKNTCSGGSGAGSNGTAPVTGTNSTSPYTNGTAPATNGTAPVTNGTTSSGNSSSSSPTTTVAGGAATATPSSPAAGTATPPPKNGAVSLVASSAFMLAAFALAL